MSFKNVISACPWKHVIVFVIFVVGALSIHFFRSDFFAQVNSRTEEMTNKTAYIARTKDELSRFEQNYANTPKPISNNEVDWLQNNLIAKMSEYHLNVVSMRSISQNSNANSTQSQGATPDKKNANKMEGVEFESTVNGSWENTMQYLYYLQNGQYLITIRSIKLEATPDLNVKTTYKYKVYVE